MADRFLRWGEMWDSATTAHEVGHSGSRVKIKGAVGHSMSDAGGHREEHDAALHPHRAAIKPRKLAHEHITCQSHERRQNGWIQILFSYCGGARVVR